MITAEDFCYKLQGFAEIGSTVPTNVQWNRIMELADDVQPPSEYDSATSLMRPDQFANWLKGFIEIADRPSALLPNQWTIIQDHLALVFTKVTPDRNEDEEDKKECGEIPSLEKILEDIHKKGGPFPDDPWKKGGPPIERWPDPFDSLRPICKGTTLIPGDDVIDAKSYCAAQGPQDDLVFCTSSEELAELAMPNGPRMLCGGGSYPLQEADELGDDPGGYK